MGGGGMYDPTLNRIKGPVEATGGLLELFGAYET